MNFYCCMILETWVTAVICRFWNCVTWYCVNDKIVIYLATLLKLTFNSQIHFLYELLEQNPIQNVEMRSLLQVLRTHALTRFFSSAAIHLFFYIVSYKGFCTTRREIHLPIWVWCAPGRTQKTQGKREYAKAMRFKNILFSFYPILIAFFFYMFILKKKFQFENIFCHSFLLFQSPSPRVDFKSKSAYKTSCKVSM